MTDEQRLTEIRERYDAAEAEWSAIRSEGDIDFSRLAGAYHIPGAPLGSRPFG